MRNINRKWWLTVLALLLLMPVASATPWKSKTKKHHSVPEGGSALVYLLGAGMTSLGAMVVRSRSAKPKQL
ncbi:MAG TPA: hypothetical protein VF845_07190 [Terriglobales bacterium]